MINLGTRFCVKNNNEKETSIAGYCASSTKFSEHSLKKDNYFYFQTSVVFSGWCDKKIWTKTGKWENSF